MVLVPKTHIPNYQEFYEARRFEQAPQENTLSSLMVKRYLLVLTMFLLQQLIQILNLELKFVKIFGYQMPQVSKLALNGANLILNPSASNEITTKSDYRRLLVSSQSARLVCGYVYCNAGRAKVPQMLFLVGITLLVKMVQ